MDLNQLAEHVTDSSEFVLPFVQIHLPKVFDFQLTRYMVLELIVAAAMLAIFIPYARRVAKGDPPRGRFWNMLDALLLFLRDGVARPAIGRKDADRFLPFVWTMFFFVLFCNLIGILPWTGSPTGSLMTTASLAGVAFCTVLGAGVAKFGPVGYWKSLVPRMDVGGVLGILLTPMIFGIEVAGLLIRHLVLAVRLLANIFAGHLVLAVIVGFIGWTAQAAFVLWAGVTVPSLLGASALTLLELFVALLQAYIFAFLSALFIGMAVHPH
ncbi:MAG: F0F1 ATP synthase subunit A [Planctomycetes bacterium]|nr:F0F1 ATP synthase subunit A [Planctomycetota bacterium]MCG2683082.1 F0F1 ATP synthase subunit A [Planctomycetales bacterium]